MGNAMVHQYTTVTCALCQGTGKWREDVGVIIPAIREDGECGGCRGVGSVEVRSPAEPCKSCDGKGSTGEKNKYGDLRSRCIWCSGCGWFARRRRGGIRWSKVVQLLVIFGGILAWVALREFLGWGRK